MYDLSSGLDLYFMVLLLGMVVFAFLIQEYPTCARLFGFCVSCYGLISNDSIQTLGIFITANVHRTAWWVLWLFITLLFVFTASVSWLYYDGNVTYDRLAIEEVGNVSFWQLLAPLALIFLTRMGVPVSTTFLLLSTFVTDVHRIQEVIVKSALGYVVAFGMALLVWSVRFAFVGKGYVKGSSVHAGWFFVQWLSSGLLWCIWLVQDGANMAIFLPRHMSVAYFLGFLCLVGVLLMLLFYRRGGNIQEVVNAKTGVTDVRAASFVNTFYLLLLFVFTIYNKTPMSTTWLFIGLLGGRELAGSVWVVDKKYTKKQRVRKSVYLIGRDLLYALVGLVFSIGLSLFVNPVVMLW